MTNIINNTKILSIVISLMFSPLLVMAGKNDCISLNIRKNLIVKSDWDGIYHFLIQIKSREDIRLLYKTENNDEYYLDYYSQIATIIKKYYCLCDISPDTILKVKVDTSSGVLEITVEPDNRCRKR